MKTRTVLSCVWLAGLLGATACEDRSRYVEHYKPHQDEERDATQDDLPRQLLPRPQQEDLRGTERDPEAGPRSRFEEFEKVISLVGQFENEVVSVSVDGDLFHRIAVNNDGIIAHTGYELTISKKRCEIELVNWGESNKLSSMHSCHPKVIGLTVRGKVHELVLDSLKNYSYVVIVDDSLHIQMSDTARVRKLR